jgi:hypothetical protein
MGMFPSSFSPCCSYPAEHRLPKNKRRQTREPVLSEDEKANMLRDIFGEMCFLSTGRSLIATPE